MNGKNKKDKIIHDIPNDFNYFLTLFKIEGHTTWRAMMSMDSKSFGKSLASDEKHPKVIDIKIMKINRITGIITEQEEE